MAESPVRFETVAKRLGVTVDVVLLWATKPEFPLAGEGVAICEAVKAWAEKHNFLNVSKNAKTLQPVAETLESFGDPVPVPDEMGIVWVTIRVPIKVDSDGLRGSNPYLTLNLTHHDRHIRKAMGQVMHGCRDSHAKMIAGNHVDRISQSLKWVFEQIAIACESVVGNTK